MATLSSKPSSEPIPGTATGVETHPAVAKPAFKHPLDQLTPEEIVAASLAIRTYALTIPEPIKAIRFINIGLLPAPKRDVLAYLGIPLVTGEKPEEKKEIVRKAEADFIDVLTGNSYNAVLSLKDTTWVVDTLEKLGDGVQPQISVEELLLCEEIIRNDERVIKLAKEVGVEKDQLCADGWAIGYDERFPEKQRIQQALLFARFGRHENLYAHPMDFIPVVDSLTQKVIHIDFPPHYTKTSATSTLSKLSSGTTVSPPLSSDQFKAADRVRVPPPSIKHDFLPDLIAETKEKEEKKKWKQRDDIKPLHVVQPEGVSFKVTGNEVEWQKWKFHVSFHHREGLVLSTVTYNDDGLIRPILYRLSLAEMVVPYGTPEHPHPRKFAFDSGEYGMGNQANELSLGCDCLGQIHYFPGAFVKHDGSAFIIKNVICLHEEDAGLLWKHTDFRVGGRGHAVRARRLVVQMICTLANYEYIFNYRFYQDGNIELEIRLTGILQVYAEDPATPNSNPFATTIAPGVSAHYHQHIFSLRVDPMIDGLANTVVETDVLSLPDAPTGSPQNFAGNAFTTRATPIVSTRSGGRDFDLSTDRRWAITSANRKHPVSGKPTSYSIMSKGTMTPVFAREDSWVQKRAGFTKRALWVVKDKEGPKGSRTWPSGKYVPGTRVAPVDSITEWVEKEEDESLEGEDVLLYLTAGITHIPRPEDWPVMPQENLNILFRPVHFFRENPALDVPAANDSHSVPAFPNGTAGACCSTR
ncbi:peroxisomal copper amine oxidase [Irpex rosettiformis]|uniref:Peroxisomal copper amine oxidase n=1 Tax=Irpex rosettiformis TaxID=378272 RepID=A0ACB8TR05_9APHY|nr:peroxisomal copper amine oxidase [Irpex rosettiformis]